MLTEMSNKWWLFLVRGLIAILYGVLAFIWPGQAWLALVIVFGIFMLLDGIFTLVAGIDFLRFFDRGWAVVLEGVVGIVIGVATLIWRNQASQVLVYTIAIWAVVTGIFEIVTASRIRFFIPGEWSMILAGILSILFGVLLFVFPGAGQVGLVWAMGFYAIFFGTTQIFFSSRLHGLKKLAKLFEAPTA